MDKKSFLLLLCLFALHVQAQNQKVTYQCHTDFSKIHNTILPADWNFNGESHQFTIDSLNHYDYKSLT